MFQTIEFKTPSVLFGMDTAARIGKEAKRLGGHRVLIVTGPRIKAAGLLEKRLSSLKAEALDVEVIVEERTRPSRRRRWWKRWPISPGRAVSI